MMICEDCGAETRVNWGGEGVVLCESCFEKKPPNKNHVTQVGIDASKIYEIFLGEGYKTGVIVSKVVSAIGWVICALALVLALVAFEKMGRMGAMAIGPSVGILIGGLLLVVAGQANRALLENANNTRQMLELMKKEK